MKKTLKTYSARLLAVVLVAALLIPSMVISMPSAGYAGNLGGSTTASQTVTTGLTYEKVVFTKGGSGQTAYIMDFNPKTTNLMPMAYQKTSGWGSLTSASVEDARAKGYTVYGAINGEFFSPATGTNNNWGTLTGRLITNGRIISDHEGCNEICMTVDNEGNLQLVKSQMSYHFYVEGKEMGSAAIARVNKRYNKEWHWDPICYFDSSVGTKSDTISTYPGTEVVVRKTEGTELTVGGVLQGEVVSVNTNTYGTSFNKDEYVLYAWKDSSYASQLAALKPGQKVQIYAQELNDDAREAMTNAVMVSSATYPIVLDGKDNTDNTPNASDIYLTRAQRTAMGVKADGSMVFMCVDGRGTSENNNKGVTLPELADMMIDMGCVTAIGLDGGGSTTMYVGKDEVIDYGRAVGSSILIVGRDGQATSSTAKQELNDWIYNASTTSYPSAEQTALVQKAIAEANAVYNNSKSMTADFVREKMDLQMAMGVVTSVAPKTFISLDANDWSFDGSIMQAKNDANGALVFNNTNGQWPAATFGCDITVPATHTLYFDITVAGQSSVNLYTKNGTEIKLNKFIAPGSIDAGSEDIIGNGKTFKGSVNVSQISGLGGSTISSIKIFAVGGKGDGSKVTVRELSFRNPYSGGDINGSGKVDSSDARVVLRHIGGMSPLTGEILAAADANGDGVVNTDDIRYMLKKRVGLA